MNAQVVTVCSHNRPEPYYRPDSFIESLHRFAEKPTILGSTTPFMGLMTKALLYRDWLRAGNNTSDRLILCDAFDILFLAHPHGIGDRCAEWFGADAVVFNGERGLWPCAELADDFPDTGPYRYLNSGFICGPAEKILAMFESMDLESIGVDREGPNGRIEPNDQGEIQRIYAKQPVRMVVDGMARLAMTMHGAKPEEFEIIRDRVLYNKLTGTMPGVAHFNGSGFNDYHHLFREHWGFEHEKGPIDLP